MPANSFGYFLCARDAGFVPGAGGSQGALCLSGAVRRFNGQIQNSGAGRAIEIPIDLLALPQPTGSHTVLIGETWRFQCWFRDANPTTTSNLSDGVAVAFR